MDASLFASAGFSIFAIIIIALGALCFSSYVKIVTILGVVRAGFGIESIPAGFVTGALALSLSFFIMYPTLERADSAFNAVVKTSVSPVSDVKRSEAMTAAINEWRKFVEANTQPEEVERYSRIAAKSDNLESEYSKKNAEVLKRYHSSWRVLAPAFIVSELKEAFQTGLAIFLPFLVIDILVAAILSAVGMSGINPLIAAFPFKLLLFVFADGWSVITANIITTYGV